MQAPDFVRCELEQATPCAIVVVALPRDESSWGEQRRYVAAARLELRLTSSVRGFHPRLKRRGRYAANFAGQLKSFQTRAAPQGDTNPFGHTHLEKVSGTFSRSTDGLPARVVEKVPDTFSTAGWRVPGAHPQRLPKAVVRPFDRAGPEEPDCDTFLTA